MQRIEFIGNLTFDPVQRETSSGNVTNFTVAVDRSSKEPVTDFFRVQAWNKLGDNCFQYLKKGKKVFVEGELRARTYENDDGKTIMSLDVAAYKVEFLSPKDEPVQNDKPKKKYTEADFTDIQSDDIPF